MDIEYTYTGKVFEEVDIIIKNYSEEYFYDEILLESDVFYELRKSHNITPTRLNESTKEELEDIKILFRKYINSFFFVYNQSEIIGSILIIDNYIQSLAISKKYQRQYFGEKLVKYAVNLILSKGYSEVKLKVLDGNFQAENLYKKLGFQKKES